MIHVGHADEKRRLSRARDRVGELAVGSHECEGKGRGTGDELAG